MRTDLLKVPRYLSEADTGDQDVEMTEPGTISMVATYKVIDVVGDEWGRIKLYAASSYTEYDFFLGPVFFAKETESVYVTEGE